MVTEMSDASFQEKEKWKGEGRMEPFTMQVCLREESTHSALVCTEVGSKSDWGLFSGPNQDSGCSQKFNWDLKTSFVLSEGLFQQLENI